MDDRGSMLRRSVGDHLRRARETLGWTLREVAERASPNGVKVSASTLSRLERGDTSVAFEEILALAGRVLNMPDCPPERVLQANAWPTPQYGSYLASAPPGDSEHLAREGGRVRTRLDVIRR